MRIVGRTITLRPYVEADAEGIWSWSSDSETTLYLGRRFRKIRSLEEIREGLKQIIQNENTDDLFFVISDTATGEYLGGIDITSIDAIDGNGILSIVISKKERRNSGVGTEAVCLILQHAFFNRGLHKVELRVLEDNVAAIRCYQKVGFQIEGKLRDHMVIGRKYCDMICMGILKNEFRVVKNR